MPSFRKAKAKNGPVYERKGSSARYRIGVIIFFAAAVVFQENQLGMKENKVMAVPQAFKETAVVELTSRNVLQPLPSSKMPTMPTVLRNDTVMIDGSFVIAPYRLIFFANAKVGCTIWKQLFQRIRGHKTWNIHTADTHKPRKNGLINLKHYTTEQAQQMLASPEWTKATWVRDPKERFLSAYLDKAFKKDGIHLRRCCQKQQNQNQTACFEEGRSSLKGFLHIATTVCPNDCHWIPQHHRIDRKYWPILAHPHNTFFVGHLENGQADAKALLSRLYETNDALSTAPGFRPKDKQLNEMITDPFVPSSTNQSLWDRYCTSGWDKGDDTGTSPVSFLETTGTVMHSTGADTKLAQYYDEDAERAVGEYYAGDYESQVLDLERKPIVYPKK